MQNENNSYRIRTEVGSNSPNILNVKLNQTFDFLNILSLKINQKNLYKMPASPVGVVIGRVLANQAYGIENAKVSIFIPRDNVDFTVKDNILYGYSTVNNLNSEGVRYNLLPSYVDEACHQNVGTFYEKEYVLDNNDIIKVFDKYYTYTTRTNGAGDYFIYGVPVGQHTLHVDVDLSDIGKLSVRPHDMIGQGYDIGQFESPNKFKSDKNLNILPQIKSQDKPIDVYPFWGDTSEDDTNGTITRADIEIDYKFEPTAVFMGSIVSDKGNNSISHKCVPSDKCGKMSELITGEGQIEMIRKTFDGKVEQFSVKGNRVIDGDGVWCYQIPMNLDYVKTDEFGNIVPSDNPEKGIPTRARVRFRVSMDEDLMDDSAKKRARFLVPNNPRLSDDYPEFKKTHEADYEFGTYTRDESYRDMFWNNVYTVKSYIPRLQKRTANNHKKFTGIKMTNHSGDNNPMPYNNLSIKMGFVYRFLCVLMVIFFHIVSILNSTVLLPLAFTLYAVGQNFKNIAGVIGVVSEKAEEWFMKIACSLWNASAGMLIKFDSDFCNDGGVPKTYILGIEGWITKFSQQLKSVCRTCGTDSKNCSSLNGEIETDMNVLVNCVQNSLAQDNEVTSFNFQNDWVNGVLYAPLWYRKIKPKRRIFFGLIQTEVKDDWCDGSTLKMAGKGKGLKLYQTCAQQRTLSNNGQSISPVTPSNPKSPVGYNENNCYGNKCHQRTISVIQVDKGLIVRKETKYGEYVYYYKSVEYDNALGRIGGNKNEKGEVKILFATDIVLLGSLNDCDSNGIPQFFKHLNETTYNMPPDLLSLDWETIDSSKKLEVSGDEIVENAAIDQSSVHTEFSGADYGNIGWDQLSKTPSGDYTQEGNQERDNGGLFYNLTCNFSFVKPKCCINMSRVCEFGVSLDQSIDFGDNDREVSSILPPDGFISYDEMYNMDARSMFATMNGNNLRVKQDNKTGYPVYDFNYLYTENFDGTLSRLMKDTGSTKPFYNNYKLEQSSDAYLKFRYGYDNKVDFKVGFYKTNNEILNGLYKIATLDSGYNNNRFPRYENSFYFYFGLKSGKTAIDKFRKEYYAECQNDDPAESSIILNYVGNSWCNDAEETTMDGYVSLDLSKIELPCTIQFDERRNGDTSQDRIFQGIYHPKIYISYQHIQSLEDDGYVQLKVDRENKKEVEEGFNGQTYTYPLANGYYVMTIVDNDGEIYRQTFLMEKEKLKFNTEVVDFMLTETELEEQYQQYLNSWVGIQGTYPQSFSEWVATNTNTSVYDEQPLRDIGGYVTVSLITDNGVPLDDNFIVRITPESKIEDAYSESGTSTSSVYIIYEYTGAEYKRSNGVSTHDSTVAEMNPNEYTFYVPKKKYQYFITVTQLCNGVEGNNTVTTSVYVNEPQPYKMFVNGIDTSLLSDFKTGYYSSTDNGIVDKPFGNTNTDVVNNAYLIGWLNIDRVGVRELLKYPEDELNLKRYSDISSIVAILRYGYNNGWIPYKFSEDYCFNPNSFEMELEIFYTAPDPSSMNTTPPPKYILVYNQNDEKYYIQEYNSQTNQYQQKTDINNQSVETLTLEEYFDGMGYEAQVLVIDAINEVIQKRLDLVDAMIDAFWMYDNNEEGKNITVSYESNNTPIETLIYYIKDDSPREYQLLDVNKEENTIIDFINPTIYSKRGIRSNTSEQSARYFKYDANTYKRPPFASIANKFQLTIPKDVPYTAFESNTVKGVEVEVANSTTIQQKEVMFGFHIMDKRPYTISNVWLPIKEYPIYWPAIAAGWKTRPRGFMSMNGCYSGFFFNGLSTSTTPEAEFISQRIGDNDFKIYTQTLTTRAQFDLPVNYPLEYNIPTQRLIYSEPPLSGYQGGYNDFWLPIGENELTINGINYQNLMENNNMINTRYHYLSFGVGDKTLIVQDRKSTYIEQLYSGATFGYAENTHLYPDMPIPPKPQFIGLGKNIEVNYRTRVHYKNGNIIGHWKDHPLFKKWFEESPNICVPGNNQELDMRFNAPLPPYNGGYTTFTDEPNWTYVIGYSSDGKYRAVSPIYEISPVNVRLQNNWSTYKTLVRIIFSDLATIQASKVTDYYLRFYEYSIVVYLGADLLYETEKIQPQERFDSYEEPIYLDSNYLDIHGNLFPSYHIYVKDITGILRDINNLNT